MGPKKKKSKKKKISKKKSGDEDGEKKDEDKEQFAKMPTFGWFKLEVSVHKPADRSKTDVNC